MWIGGTGITAMLMIAVALAWLHGRAPDRARPSWTDQARQATFASHIGVDHSDVDADRARAAYTPGSPDSLRSDERTNQATGTAPTWTRAGHRHARLVSAM